MRLSTVTCNVKIKAQAKSFDCYELVNTWVM